jgi:hypothetical protein
MRSHMRDVGGPAGSNEVAKRCTEATRTVGPTLINGRWLTRIQIILVVVLSPAGPVYATVHKATGNIKTSLLDKLQNDYLPKNTNQYVTPSSNDLAVWRQVMFNLYTGNLATAADLVSGIAPKYRIVNFTDTSETPRSYYVLIEGNVSGGVIEPTVEKGWGVFVFDPRPVRQLMLQAPHPVFDTNTDKQAVEGLLVVRPRALFLFTSHRCASDSPSVQVTSATPCDFPPPGYRMSDPPHGASSASPPVTNPFQVAHEEFVKLYPSDIGIQFHGNGQTSICPKLFLSNTGDDGFVIPNGFLAQLHQRLLLSFPDARIYDGADSCPLAGTENLQGRFSNGSMNPVVDSSPAPHTVETFIHIEQLLAGVRDTEANRLNVLQAIADVFKPVRTVRGQLISQ